MPPLDPFMPPPDADYHPCPAPLPCTLPCTLLPIISMQLAPSQRMTVEDERSPLNSSPQSPPFLPLAGGPNPDNDY